MKVGIVLPVFQADDLAAMAMVDAAEKSGMDGVFAPDHRISPSGGPTQPVLEVLRATAERTERLRFGSLVARVGARPAAELTEALTSIDSASGGRLVAGLGIGDSRARKEDESLGLPWIPREERLMMLREQVRSLKSFGIEVWLGGQSTAIRSLAAEEDVTLNIWDAVPEKTEAAVTWGGRVEADEHGIAARLGELSAKGVTWAVFLLIGSGREPERAVETLVAARGIASL